MNKVKEREYSLDILKLLAILVILLHHYQQIFEVQFERINFYNGKFYWGSLVELFFILSGYFTYKYVSQIDQESRFLIFYKNKFLRFFPMLVITGSINVLLSFIVNVLIKKEGLPFSLWEIVISLMGIMRWFTTDEMVNNPVWYISILLLCYIMFFFITRFAKRIGISPYIGYCSAMILGVIMIQITNRGIVYPLFNEFIGRGLCTFFEGIIFRKILDKIEISLKIYIGCLISLLVFCVCYNYAYDFLEKDFWYTLVFLVYPCLIIIVKKREIPYYKILKNLGNISYNIFMWHLSVYMVFEIIYWTVGFNFNSVCSEIIVIATTCFIGIISYYVVDKPISQWIRSKCK